MSTPRAKDLLQDMSEACDFILQFTAGMDEPQFLGNVMAQHAVIRDIEVLGETAKRFIDEVPDAASRFLHVPFAKMYVTRKSHSRLLHASYGYDLEDRGERDSVTPRRVRPDTRKLGVSSHLNRCVLPSLVRI